MSKLVSSSLVSGRLPGCLAFVITVAAMAGCQSKTASSGELMLGAAASLRGVVPDLTQRFSLKFPDTKVVVTYAGSGTLRGQVEAGAPIDLLVLAGPSHIDRLIERGLAIRATRSVVATNAIVLVTPQGRPELSFNDLGQLGEGKLLALGTPSTVPVGRYAREVLSNLGLWKNLAAPPADHLVYGNDVAAVLAYARRGEVDAAIVYATDARRVSGVVVSDRARGDWAPQPQVVAVVTTEAGAISRGATKFIQWLSSPPAQELFVSHGFPGHGSSRNDSSRK